MNKENEANFQTEIDRIFELQKQNRWKIANSTAKERIQKIQKLGKAIEAKKDELKDALRKDFQKSPYEVELTEIMPIVQEIRDVERHLYKWMQPVSVSSPLTMFGSSSKIVYEPKGLVFIIGPWNYPFHLVMAPLIAAIAAGNCVIIRPSNNTCNTSEFIKSIIESVFPKEEVAVFTGEREIANHLLTKPFDHIFFTGSPSVGTMIMQAAAKNLTSVTLELGGKSPVILDETANLDYSAQHIVWGKVLNGGQTCVGVDYLLIHESRKTEFIEKAKSQLKEFYGENINQWQSNFDFCRIINKKNFERLKFLIDSSVAQGAKIEIGGLSDPAEKYISPTILSGVRNDMPIMQEEIFGPILPILTYTKLEDAIQIIQEKSKPLALYIFSESDSHIKKILANTSSGGAVVNGAIVHLTNPNLPFGGVNHSGMGSYHGHFGFKAFSHERAVLKVNKLNIFHKLFPPYGNFTGQLLDIVSKYVL